MRKTFLRRSVTTGVQNNINASPWRMSVRRGKDWTRSRPQVHPVVTGHQARPRAQPVTERQSVRASFTSQNKWERSGRFVLLIAFHKFIQECLQWPNSGFKLNAWIINITKELIRRSGRGKFPAATWKTDAGNVVFLGFLGYELVYYMSQRLNLFTQSEKFESLL